MIVVMHEVPVDAIPPHKRTTGEKTGVVPRLLDHVEALPSGRALMVEHDFYAQQLTGRLCNAWRLQGRKGKLRISVRGKHAYIWVVR